MLYMPVYIVSTQMFYRGCITDASPVYNISITVLYMCYTPVDNIPFFTVKVIEFSASFFVICEAERSHPGQIRHTDFEFTIRFLVKRHFPVARDENMSSE